MPLYALNLFDLAGNDLYLRYSRRSPEAAAKHGGRVVALGLLDEALESEPGVEPRTAMILVEWPSREAFAPSWRIRSSRIFTLSERAGRAITCGGPMSVLTISGPSSPSTTTEAQIQ